MTIRPATPADAQDIARIWNAEITCGISTFNSEKKELDDVVQMISDRDGACFISERSGLVTGFATYAQFRGGVGYAHSMEHTLYLAPASRGYGTGRALMDRVESAAKGQGAHCLIAGIGGENTVGIAFHSALGFVEVGRLPQVGYKFGRWMDLVLMQKIL